MDASLGAMTLEISNGSGRLSRAERALTIVCCRLRLSRVRTGQPNWSLPMSWLRLRNLPVRQLQGTTDAGAACNCVFSQFSRLDRIWISISFRIALLARFLETLLACVFKCVAFAAGAVAFGVVS